MNAVELRAMLNFAGEARLSEPMSEHTSLGIGGPAEAMAFPRNTEELSNLQAKALANGVPVFILGKGTNLLVLDGGIPGLVINLPKMNWIIKEHADGENLSGPLRRRDPSSQTRQFLRGGRGSPAWSSHPASPAP